MKFLKALFFIQVGWAILSPLYGLTYLEIEQMIRTGMDEALIQAQIEKNNDYFTFDEIIYLRERNLSEDLTAFLLRYHLSFIPDIDVAFLVRMKSVPLSDEIIQLLVDRFGVISLPLTPDDIMTLKNAEMNEKLIEYLIFSSQ